MNCDICDTITKRIICDKCRHNFFISTSKILKNYNILYLIRKKNKKLSHINWMNRKILFSELLKKEHTKEIKKKIKEIINKSIDYKRFSYIELNTKFRLCHVCIKKKYCINHHITYFPEFTIPVCKNCHKKIHLTDKYEELKPPDGDADIFYGSKYVRFKLIRNHKIRVSKRQKLDTSKMYHGLNQNSRKK